MHVLHLASGFVLKYIPDWQAKYQLKADIASACSNLWLKGFPQISPGAVRRKTAALCGLDGPASKCPFLTVKSRRNREWGKPHIT